WGNRPYDPRGLTRSHGPGIHTESPREPTHTIGVPPAVSAAPDSLMSHEEPSSRIPMNGAEFTHLEAGPPANAQRSCPPAESRAHVSVLVSHDSPASG